MYRSRWSLSPSGKWAAFIAYSEERYYSEAEFQDIVLVYIDNLAEPVTVTLHRGGLDYAWSPDGSKISYRDYDAIGVRQLYVSDLEHKDRLRVAPVNLSGIRWLAWSDDSRTIAFFSPARQEGSEKDTIYWINAGNGVIRRELNSSKVSEGWFSSVFSFLHVRLIGITNYLPTTNSYSYDYQTKELKVITMPDILENPDYIEAVVAPAEFPGEEACSRP